MNKGMVTMGAAVLSLTLASAASAGLSYIGAGGVIPDAGTGVFTSDIVVGDSGSLQDITVTLGGLNHTWSGDLVATIQHVESGLTQTLFARVGKTAATTGFGDSSNFNGDYSFNDSFAGNLWLAAEGGGTDFIIPGGNYFASAELTGAQVSLLSIFGGQEISGTWRLSIEDFAGGDTGSLGSWTLDLVVPAPAGLALLAMGGVVRRRRRTA